MTAKQAVGHICKLPGASSHAITETRTPKPLAATNSPQLVLAKGAGRREGVESFCLTTVMKSVDNYTDSCNQASGGSLRWPYRGG